jgi:hypothetical protein
MFTLYGNQYESREEHLLLTMFQVCLGRRRGATLLISRTVCPLGAVRDRYRL